MKNKLLFLALCLLAPLGYAQSKTFNFDIENSNVIVGRDSQGKAIALEAPAGQTLKIQLNYQPNAAPKYILKTQLGNVATQYSMKKVSPNSSTVNIVTKNDSEKLELAFYDTPEKLIGQFVVKLNTKKKKDAKEAKLPKNGREATSDPLQEDQKDRATGNVLEDALLLYKYKDGSNLKLVLDILSTAADKPLEGTQTVLEKQFKDNTYLTEYIKATWKNDAYGEQILALNGGASAQGGDNKGTLSTIASATGSLDVTKFADGLARFLVKRTKEELSITFFEKFKEELEKYPDIQTVFPQTYRSLKAIDKDIYMFKAYIQTLRESFELDLASLPDNLPSIMENHQDFFEVHPKLKATLESSFYIASAVKVGTHPGEMIEDFDDSIWTDVGTNTQAYLQTLKLFSISLKRSGTNDNYWLPYTEIQKMFSNTDLLKLYLGLLEEKAKLEDINFGASGKLYTIIDKASAQVKEVEAYKKFVKDLSQKIKLIEVSVKELPQTENDSLRFEKYYGIVSKSLDVLKTGTKITELPHFTAIPTDYVTLSQTYIASAQSLADIGIEVVRRNYSAAVANIAYLINKNSELYVKETQKAIDLNKEIADKNTEITMLAPEDTTKEAKKTALKAKEQELQNYLKTTTDTLSTRKIHDSFFKYGSFMAAITKAKDPEEVENVIEAFALPTGSARIKRETDFNVALNAYCGLYFGGEKIKGFDSCYRRSVGVAAPVGVSMSWGNGTCTQKPRKHHTSRSVFFSLIDLGAITAYRFDDENTESFPKVELKDIVSPGIFFSYGLRNCPISVNVGYQLGPLLRKVDAAENTYQNSYTRLSIALVVDIPLLNFYTRNNQKN